MKKNIEIEDYFGDTIMSFIIDSYNDFELLNLNDCSIADTDDDYIYGTKNDLIRVQSDLFGKIYYKNSEEYIDE